MPIHYLAMPVHPFGTDLPAVATRYLRDPLPLHDVIIYPTSICGGGTVGRPTACAFESIAFVLRGMAAAIGQTIFRKVLKGKAAEYEPQDPYYIYEERPGKSPKKKVKPLPPGLTLQDQKVLRKVRRRAHLLDRSIKCCCCCNCQFGVAAILGMVPVVGDLSSFVLGYRLVTGTATQIDGGLPESIRAQMVAINMAALGIGFVPIVGDIINATIKPNSRNAALFEAWLVKNRAGHGAGIGHGAGTTTSGPGNVTGSSTTGAINGPSPGNHGTYAGSSIPTQHQPPVTSSTSVTTRK